MRTLVQDALDYEGQYDHADHVRPTEGAFWATWRLIVGAVAAGASVWPPISLGGLGDGGLSVQWGGQNHYVRLLMPPDPKQAYLFTRGPGQSGVVHPATAESLAHCLRALSSG